MLPVLASLLSSRCFRLKAAATALARLPGAQADLTEGTRLNRLSSCYVDIGTVAGLA